MEPHGWQEALYRQWIATQSRALSPSVASIFHQLDSREALTWILRFQRPRSAVSSAVASWCFQGEPRAWRIAAGAQWAHLDAGAEVWLAYPEPLGHDPLAMCGLELVWAERVHQGWESAVTRLGPLLAPAAYRSGIESQTLNPVLASWLDAYTRTAEASGMEQVVAWARRKAERVRERPSYRWPEWPGAAARYAEHLRAGVVPHEARSGGPHDMRAVLLGLASLAEDEGQLSSLALVHKAVQAVSLSLGWNGTGPEGD